MHHVLFLIITGALLSGPALATPPTAGAVARAEVMFPKKHKHYHQTVTVRVSERSPSKYKRVASKPRRQPRTTRHVWLYTRN